jgi:hypothetical protein
MDLFQFLASIVKSLAWPVAVLVLAILLRVPLARLLTTLTHLKYKDLELDFGRELKQLEKEAKAIDITPRQPRSVAPSKSSPQQLLEEAARLAQDFPQPAVAVGWQAVEDELLSAVMRLAISPDYPPHNSALKNAEMLREQNAIDERTFELLNRMRMLRNLAVHGARNRVPITGEEAVEFLALARGVVEKLQALRRA